MLYCSIFIIFVKIPYPLSQKKLPANIPTMAFKVFRLHQAKTKQSDWHKSEGINAAHIQTINDPSQNNATLMSSGIASPFARVLLTKEAFEHIIHHDLSLEGNTQYHRLISETLDLLSLIFNFENFKSAGINLSWKIWERNDKIKTLKESNYPSHQTLAQTLDLFWQEALGNQACIYMLCQDFLSLGGFCKDILAFSSPEFQKTLQKQEIFLGNEQLGSDDYLPLYKRNKDFQLYLYTWFEAQTQAKNNYGLLYAYMQKSLKFLQEIDTKLANEIRNLSHSNSKQNLFKLQKDYLPLSNAETLLPIFILEDNLCLYTAKLYTDDNIKSDFLLGQLSKKHEEKILVLQNNCPLPYDYWQCYWQVHFQVPYVDERPIKDRVLPHLQVKFPYLTVSDFLTPELLEVPFPIDEKHFYVPKLINFKNGKVQHDYAFDKHYLLPLQSLFFQYFNPEDLYHTYKDGNSMLSFLKLSSESIKVILRLPLANKEDYITLERTYFYNSAIDLKENIGAVNHLIFNIAILPFYKNIPNKRLILLERDNFKQSTYQIQCYRKESTQAIDIGQATQRSNREEGGQANSYFWDIQEDYDYIKLTANGASAYIIPKFLTYKNENTAYTFSIDFGTNNTHIAYAPQGGKVENFSINTQDQALIPLHNPLYNVVPREIDRYFLYECMPYTLEHFPFPIRTALAENKGQFYQHRALIENNIAFHYEKLNPLPQSQIFTQLKWSNIAENKEEQARVKAYLETLILIIHNKVLFLGGDFGKVQIIWFYPSSMRSVALTSLENIWLELVRKYFPNAPKPIKYAESIAPYYYKADSKPTIHSSINIDIGGGTSDIVIFENEQAKVQTSYRFAAQALFHTAYLKGNTLENGFVQYFKTPIATFLKEHYYQLHELNSIYEDLTNSSNSNADMLMNFFFSLDKIKGLDFSFTRLLQQDEKFKILYYVFYGAQLYHLAQIIKSTDTALPQYIFFSGNGSKILDLLDSSEDWEALNALSKIILERAVGRVYHKEGLELHKSISPKTATCKGGIRLFQDFAIEHKTNLKEIVWISENFKNEMQHNSAIHVKEPIQYKDINDEIILSTITQVEACLELLLVELPKFFNLQHFGIQAKELDKYHNILKKNLKAYLHTGLQHFQYSKLEQINTPIFFYPLLGALHELGLCISNTYKYC